MDMSMVENRAVWCAAEVSKSQTWLSNWTTKAWIWIIDTYAEGSDGEMQKLWEPRGMVVKKEHLRAHWRLREEPRLWDREGQQGGQWSAQGRGRLRARLGKDHAVESSCSELWAANEGSLEGRVYVLKAPLVTAQRVDRAVVETREPRQEPQTSLLISEPQGEPIWGPWEARKSPQSLQELWKGF